MGLVRTFLGGVAVHSELMFGVVCQ
jgi:hypothetical protein